MSEWRNVALKKLDELIDCGSDSKDKPSISITIFLEFLIRENQRILKERTPSDPCR